MESCSRSTNQDSSLRTAGLRCLWSRHLERSSPAIHTTDPTFRRSLKTHLFHIASTSSYSCFCHWLCNARSANFLIYDCDYDKQKQKIHFKDVSYNNITRIWPKRPRLRPKRPCPKRPVRNVHGRNVRSPSATRPANIGKEHYKILLSRIVMLPQRVQLWWRELRTNVS